MQKSEETSFLSASYIHFDCFFIAILISKNFTTELFFIPLLKEGTTLPNEVVNELFVDTALAG